MWNLSKDQTNVPQVNSDATLYKQLQSNEGKWFEADLSSAGVNADKSFEETITYIKAQLGKVRGCQQVESVWGGNGKPYRIRLVSGLNVPAPARDTHIKT